MSAGKKIFIISILISLSCSYLAYSAFEEYEIKAVFLERFTRFIEWPDHVGMDDPLTPFNICIIGKNPFGKILDRLYAERKIKHKPVKIRYVKSVREIGSCHLLFISSTMGNDLPKILSYTKDKPILTISDSKDFARKGVHINLYSDAQGTRFVINESSVRSSGLKMSYLLLKVAEIVNPPKASGHDVQKLIN